MVKLMKIVKSMKAKKKYDAYFKLDNGKEKIVSFGAAGYSDYTIHGDKDRRERYRKRHEKDLKTNDPMRPGYLSYFLLWNKKTLKASIADFKKKFKL